MKIFVLLFSIFATSAAFAEIDWSQVKPIEEYPLFWKDKPTKIGNLRIKPPARFFTETGNRNRIVNGHEATPHQFPYQAVMLFTLPSIGGAALCGGALINPWFVLTAAHCVDGATEGLIILGAHDRTIIEPNQQRFGGIPSTNIRMHPQWTPALIQNDVAVVRLTQAAILNAFVTAIDLPPPESITTFENADAVVSGWGRYSDNSPNAATILRFYRGTILLHANCALRFPGVVLPSNICLSGLNNGGACQGDSGGPLTTTYQGRHTHIGVVSFGLALGCELLWPSVFARTSFYNSWITRTVDEWPTVVPPSA